MIGDPPDADRPFRPLSGCRAAEQVPPNLDPDHIAVFGPSAGGHLSLIAGLTGNDENYVDERWPGVSSEVSAIATFYPAAYFGESGEPGYDLGSMHLGFSPHDPAKCGGYARRVSRKPHSCR